MTSTKRAPGPDGVSNAVISKLAKSHTDELFKLCNNMLRGGILCYSV